MKKSVSVLMKAAFILLAVILFASCQKYKREISQLNISKDSVEQVVEQRNQQILDYVGDLNQIQSNLDSIKRVQKLLNVSLSSTGSEIQQDEKDKIISDINLLNNIINENKKIISSLQNKLKHSNLRVAELEKMVQNYMVQIEEKDAEISDLTAQIEKMKIDISELNEQITVITEESVQKSETIKQQKDEMSIAYYCFGSKEELVKNNVVEKVGGFIGLGKTHKIKSDFNQKYFNKVDIRDFKEILLMARKAEIISSHPDGSYHFTGSDKTIENIVIDNPEEFWKASRYLVILVEPLK